jgi:D-alanyl-D-alanine carboxypeptidase
MRSITLFLITLAFASSVSAQRGNPRVLFENESVDAMIASFMEEHDVPGMSLAIVQAPYITRATGYGVSDAQRRTLVANNTMFDVGGMRDAFTAVAAMQLVEDGRVALTEVLPLIRSRDAKRLEDLIEQKSGKSFQQFVRGRQFDALGLKHTFLGSELPGVAREDVSATERHRRFLREPALIDPTEPASARGTTSPPPPRAIFASASDISFWDIALAGDILIKDPSLRKLLYEPAQQTASSGPWFFPGRPGLMIARGSGEGSSALLSRFTHRDELLCVTLLANREGLDLTQLARRIAGAFNPKLGPPRAAAGQRVQQSPWSPDETRTRFSRAAKAREIEDKATVWEEEGQVWIAATAPSSGKALLDAALLEAVGGITGDGARGH